MFHYFRKIFTGYTTVKKNMNGTEFRYMYSGKPVFFDPLLMLREFNNRVSEESVQHLDLKTSIDVLNVSFVQPGESDLPSVICICTKNGRELKVSRFTLKDGIHPVSIYLFEENGVSFGSFRRKYDYGSKLHEAGKKLAEVNQSELDISNEKWLWKGISKECLFLEKFGHTQIWHFIDSEQVDFWMYS
ncbi:hypothetical protein D0X99_19715 [Algoriphagus lacus]|uniref:Uncharacterized protein n=2 Tax=Algoriphagus lacus TaxID=2056311 RepID=A0A418PLG7_9BACT|nr:hypothetical protein D0X99_19715 [Algoriphagus lacus]